MSYIFIHAGIKLGLIKTRKILTRIINNKTLKFYRNEK